MIAFDPDLVPVVDDVYGTVEVWRCADYVKLPLSKADWGAWIWSLILFNPLQVSFSMRRPTLCYIMGRAIR